MLERGERAPAAKEELDSVALAAVVLLEQDVRASLEPTHLLAELLRVLRVGDVVPLSAAVTKSSPPPRLHHDGPAESGSDGKRLTDSRNHSRLRRRDADFPVELERCELVPRLCVRVAAGESQSRRSGEAPAGFREQEDGLFGSGHEQVDMVLTDGSQQRCHSALGVGPRRRVAQTRGDVLRVKARAPRLRVGGHDLESAPAERAYDRDRRTAGGIRYENASAHLPPPTASGRRRRPAEKDAITSATSRETASRGRVASTTTNSRRIRPSSRYSRRRRSSDSSVPSPLRSSRTSAGASR